MKILFLHGWHSVPGGVKPTYLKNHGHEVINPALDDDDFAAAVATAQAEYDQHLPDVVVGSSRGGAIAMNINSGDTPLVLLCPAWKNWGTVTKLKSNSVILHSRADDVIPFADSEELVAANGLPPQTLIEVGTDHRLADPEPLEEMLRSCERLTSDVDSILDHPAISGRYMFPQDRRVNNPFVVSVDGAELACYWKNINPDKMTLVHFHGNGEAVADYVPEMADEFARMGLNSLFVEYREYGDSTGKAHLSAMLGDGTAVLQAAGIPPEQAIAFGRSIGSLYAIELAHRHPQIGALILESGIADPAERFLMYADLVAAGIDEAAVRAEVKRRFDHQHKLSQNSRPLLILHAENDNLIDVNHARRMYEWSGSTYKEMRRFQAGNHNTIFSVNREAYLEAIRKFLWERFGDLTQSNP